MADDGNDFKNNPFASLEIAKFTQQPAKSDNSKAIPAIDPADRAMFLRALERMPAAPQKRQSGFLLADQCQLPIRQEMKKRKPKHEVKPEPIQPTAPVTEEAEDGNPFLTAMSAVTPLAGGGRRIAQKPVLRPASMLRENSLEDFMAGKLEFAISSTGEYMEGHVAGLDDLILNRLRAGQFSPEAHIDLHGLNASQAFETLREFMRQAWLKDLRVALIVTGRGHNSPDGHGILRHKLQTWLTREPFKRIVLAFCTAKPHDGGPGSIYVLLRRFRKKGRIQWDRIFIDED